MNSSCLGGKVIRSVWTESDGCFIKARAKHCGLCFSCELYINLIDKLYVGLFTCIVAALENGGLKQVSLIDFKPGTNSGIQITLGVVQG